MTNKKIEDRRIAAKRQSADVYVGGLTKSRKFEFMVLPVMWHNTFTLTCAESWA